MYIYAQLDENNICIGVSSLSGEVNNASMVRMDTYTVDVLGKRYVDGEWQAVPQEPAPPELSQTEKDLLAIMEGVAATYERQEKSSLDIMEGLAGLYEATLSGGKV